MKDRSDNAWRSYLDTRRTRRQAMTAFAQFDGKRLATAVSFVRITGTAAS